MSDFTFDDYLQRAQSIVPPQRSGLIWRMLLVIGWLSWIASVPAALYFVALCVPYYNPEYSWQLYSATMQARIGPIATVTWEQVEKDKRSTELRTYTTDLLRYAKH